MLLQKYKFTFPDPRQQPVYAPPREEMERMRQHDRRGMGMDYPDYERREHGRFRDYDYGEF